MRLSDRFEDCFDTPDGSTASYKPFLLSIGLGNTTSDRTRGRHSRSTNRPDRFYGTLQFRRWVVSGLPEMNSLLG